VDVASLGCQCRRTTPQVPLRAMTASSFSSSSSLSSAQGDTEDVTTALENVPQRIPMLTTHANILFYCVRRKDKGPFTMILILLPTQTSDSRSDARSHLGKNVIKRTRDGGNLKHKCKGRGRGRGTHASVRPFYRDGWMNRREG
jgi:hypothetical protein